MIGKEALYDGGIFAFTPRELDLIDIPKGKAWLIGGPFLEQYYSIWDAETYRVGFIEANPNMGHGGEESNLILYTLLFIPFFILAFFGVFRCRQNQKVENFNSV